MRIKIPPSNDWLALNHVLKQIETELNKIAGTFNYNLRGRRITGAGLAVDSTDYVTLGDVQRLLQGATTNRAIVGRRTSGEDGGGGGGGTGTGGGGGGTTNPNLPLPDYTSEVVGYADAHPTEFSQSCQDVYGDPVGWAFLDGLIAYLQGIDERVGYNGKRGDVNDPSKDVIAYYHGNLPPVPASPEVYVVDVIGSHCSPDAHPQWSDTHSAGVWLPVRP